MGSGIFVTDTGGGGGGGGGGGNVSAVVFRPTGSTQLAIPMGAGDLTMAPDNVSLFKIIPSKVLIDNEVIELTGPAVAGVFPVARAQNGSVAAGHLKGAAVIGDDARPFFALATTLNLLGNLTIQLQAGNATLVPWLADTHFHLLDSEFYDATLRQPPCTVYGAPDVVIVATLGLTASLENCVFGGTASVVASIAFLTNNVEGTSVVRLATDPGIGTRMILRQGTNGLQSSSYTTRTSVPAGGGFDVTVDHPVQFSFIAAEAGTQAQTLSYYPHDIRVFGNGMILRGTCDIFVELSVATDCHFENFTIESETAVNGIVFDVGSYHCKAVNVRINSNAAQEWWITGESHYVEGCQAGPSPLGAGGGEAWLIANCIDSRFINCEGFGAGTGFTISTDDVGPSPIYPSQDLQFLGCHAYGNTTGGFVVFQGAFDIDLVACSALFNGSKGLVIDNGGTLKPHDVRVYGGSYGRNQTAGVGIDIQGGCLNCTVDGADVTGGGVVGIESDESADLRRIVSRGGNTFPVSLDGGVSTISDCDITIDAGADSAYDIESGAKAVVMGGIVRVNAAPASAVFSLVSANSTLDVRGVMFAGGSIGASTAFKTTAASQEVRRSQDVFIDAFGTAFTGAGLKNWGTFANNGATPVNTACACRAGDVPAIVRTANGGTPGLPPLVVTTTNNLQTTGINLDTSTYGFIFP